MKIFIPILGFSKAGGARVLSQLSNHWITKGHDVFFISADDSSPHYPTNAKIIKGKKCPSKIGVLFGLFFIFVQLRALVGRDDIVLANHSFTAWPVAFCKRGRAFYYVQAYEPEFYDKNERYGKNFLGYIKRFISKKSYDLGLKMVVNSPLYCDQYSIFSGCSVVLPGIDLKIMKPKDSCFSFHGDIRVGCIGREALLKGTREAIEGFNIIKQSMPKLNFKLFVAFSVPEEFLSDPDIIQVLPKNDEELARFYRSLDILIAAGHIQLGACHYPVLEGLASGVSVIHTGYLPGTPANSWLVPVKNSQAIASKIKEVIERTDERNLKILQGYEDVKNYNWEKISDDFLMLFEKS